LHNEKEVGEKAEERERGEEVKRSRSNQGVGAEG